MSAGLTAFWIGRDYDREPASDGRSRYGHEVQGVEHRAPGSWGRAA
jgi:hypothetical protein